MRIPIRFTRFFGSNRWDIETNDGKILRLPSQDYINSLENYTDLIRHCQVNISIDITIRLVVYYITNNIRKK